MASCGLINVFFRNASLAALNEPRSGLYGPFSRCLCNDGMAHGASFGPLDIEPDMGRRIFTDPIFALA